MNVEVFIRPVPDPEALDWPPVQVAIVVSIDRVTEWAQALEAVVELLQNGSIPIGPVTSVLAAPAIRGRTVRSLAHKLQTSAWPGTDLFDSWTDQLPPAHPTPLADAVLEAHQALQGLSGLAVLATRRDPTTEHQAYADNQSERFQRAVAIITEIQPRDDLIQEIIDTFSAAADRVPAELDPPLQTGASAQPLAVGIALGATGTPTPDHNLMLGLLTVSLQWDIDPVIATQLMTDTHDGSAGAAPGTLA